VRTEFGPYPTGDTGKRATPVASSSGNVANASAVATLAAGGANVMTYISGFECTCGGSTAAATVNVTVTGILGGTMTYSFSTATGVDAPSPPLVVEFNPPLQASALNTAIVVTIPALGGGNAHAAANAHGYQIPQSS